MPPTSADRSPAVLLPLLTAVAVILGVIAFGVFTAHDPGIAVAETRILTQVAAVIYAAAASWMIALLWRRWGHLLERTRTVLAPAEP